MEKDLSFSSPRRKFIGNIATAGVAAIGLSALASPLAASAGELMTEEKNSPFVDHEAWFNQIKGKHRIVYDVREPGQGHELVSPFAWSKVFLLTNAATGTPEKDNSVVVVFRHNGIPFALNDNMWSKYKLGEHFKINDPNNGSASTRNMMWKPNPAFTVPGLGAVPIGIDDLQSVGVMFCVCDMALTVNSAVVGEGMKMKGEDVKKDWMANLLPNVQVVPSGVWAIGRAQEHKCGYCNAS
jgi:intracellular sulfur oxidation DsrE/DsrF family protein